MTIGDPAARSSSRRLTGSVSLGDWLDDPVGRRLVLARLEDLGFGGDKLAQARSFPLDRLVTLSHGAITREVVEQVVRAANGGELVVEEPHIDVEALRAPRPIRQNVPLQDIQIRDPFLLHDASRDLYFLYGSTDPNIWDGPGIGFDTYRSSDLRTWEGPFPAFRPPHRFWAQGQFWAPEVHSYGDRFYMFATFTGSDGYRGTQVLAADVAEGPFRPWSNGPVTPRKWQCLDGTLVIEDGEPWIVYAQEWAQVHDGMIWAQRLAPDLKSTVGVPVFLFSASDAAWATTVDEFRTPYAVYVTDGPFAFRLGDGHLILLWSSHGEHGYAMGLAHSETGKITGPWSHELHPLWAADGGHGMILRRPDGQLILTLHQPNDSPNERARVVPLVEHGNTVRLAPGVRP